MSRLNVDQIYTRTGTGSPAIREMPVFSVQRTIDQSITTNTYNKINYNVVNFDSNGYWSTSDYRYTPLIPGYYVFNMQGLVAGSSSVPTQMIASFYKNGSLIRTGNRIVLPSAPSSSSAVVANSLLYMNGSTDYIEGWIIAVAGTPYVFGSEVNNYFEGYLVRPD